jgi:uncharacterized protein
VLYRKMPKNGDELSILGFGCTGCGYCMPCPEGVMLPTAFELYNKLHLFGETQITKLSYVLRMSGGMGATPPGFASQCVACGECLAKCPQKIEIPDFLAEVVQEMEDDHLAERLVMAKNMFTIKR